MQQRLATLRPHRWQPPSSPYQIGGCFICFGAGAAAGGAGDQPAFAAAAVALAGRIVGSAVVRGTVRVHYQPGLLALREGPLLQAAVQGLPRAPAVLLVNATARDHPRAAGLALHLGAILELPTVGVTHRPLLAVGKWPPAEAGARSPLTLGGDTVACWLRTRPRARPLAVHPAWGTNLDSACGVVLAATRRVRTPEPLREARRLARRAREAAR
jgi:deoxyribonuclease V